MVRIAKSLMFGFFICFLHTANYAQYINLTAANNTYSQNFDAALGLNSTWVNNVTVPAWYAFYNVSPFGTVNTIPAASLIVNTGTGTSLDSGIYNYGSGSPSDRSLGMVSKSNFPFIQLGLRNNDPTQKIQSITITYKGEQWRSGNSTDLANNTMEFWVNNVNVPTLNFMAPVIGTNTALDGNLASNSAVKSTTFNCTVEPNETITFKWGIYASAASIISAGLSIDDFTVTANYCATPNCAYCNWRLGGGSVGIGRVQFNTLDNNTGSVISSDPYAGAYGIFAPAGNATTTVITGQQYNLVFNTSNGTSAFAAAWFDFNQNGNFENSECRFISSGPFGSSNSALVTIPLTAVAGSMRMRVRCSYSFIQDFQACSNFSTGEVEDYTINVVAATPCNAVPPGGSISSTAPSTPICDTVNFTLTPSGNSLNSGISYQWQQAVAGTNSWSNIGSSTALPFSLIASLTNASLDYRLQSTCTNIGGTNSSVSNIVTVNRKAPTYATIPYTQDFENTWQNICDVQEVPDNSWRIKARSGNDAWRREDDGASAGWTNPTVGAYAPASSNGGNHSARFHSVASVSSSAFLYIDAASQTGDGFALEFDHISDNLSKLNIAYSTDGSLYTSIVDITTFSYGWKHYSAIIPTNSNTVTIRFSTTRVNSTTPSIDMGIDNVQVTALCSGTPTGGTVITNNPAVCTNTSVLLDLTGASTGGVTYQWQQSPLGANTFTNIPAATTIPYNYLFSGLVDVRCRVTCPISGTTSFSAVKTINQNFGTFVPTAGFVESFESDWLSVCSTKDVPSNAWRNRLPFGPRSWRREDETAANSGWSSPATGSILPAPLATNGSHAARFHSTCTDSAGFLDLHLDASAEPAAGFGIRYDHYNRSLASAALFVSYSLDSGKTFLQLNNEFNLTPFSENPAGAFLWDTAQGVVPSNSAKIIVRFQAGVDPVRIVYPPNNKDIALDNVRIVPLCNGTPAAAVVSLANNPTAVCSDSIVLLKSTIAFANALPGILYRWKEGTNPNGPFTNITNGSVHKPENVLEYRPTNITTSSITKYYVLESFCAKSGLSSLSNVISVAVQPAPDFTIDPLGDTTICSFSPVTCTATLNNGSTGLQYQWLRNNQTIPGAILPSITINQSGEYKLRVIKTATGCGRTSITSLNLTVNYAANIPIITPKDPLILVNTVQKLEVPQKVVLFKENFDSSINQMTVTTTLVTGNNQADQPWVIRTSPYAYNSMNFSSGAAGNKFMMANNQIGGSGAMVTTYLESPKIDCRNYTRITLQFRQHLLLSPLSIKSIQVSLDGGISWIEKWRFDDITYYPYTGTPNNFAGWREAFIDGFAASKDFKFRFAFTGLGNGTYWAIDDIELFWDDANSSPNDRVILWSPIQNLYLDAATTIPYMGEPTFTVYAKPSTTTKYYATSYNEPGSNCVLSDSSTVTLVSGNVWIGGVSTNWNDPSNWQMGVPTASTACVIPASSVRMPHVLAGTTAICKKLTVLTGASVTIETTGKLTVLQD